MAVKENKIWTVDTLAECGDARSAMLFLDFSIASVRAQGGRVIRLIHGSAEEGEGRGKIRERLRTFLRRAKAQKRISFFIPGELLTPESDELLYLLETSDLDKQDLPKVADGRVTYIYL